MIRGRKPGTGQGFSRSVFIRMSPEDLKKVMEWTGTTNMSRAIREALRLYIEAKEVMRDVSG
jgi:hypothetical protein